jgi:hypothetical protein
VKKIRVKYRKLGKEQAHGQVFLDRNLIEIDERLEGKQHFSTLLHELIHVTAPQLDEEFVLEMEKVITRVMLKEGTWTKK